MGRRRTRFLIAVITATTFLMAACGGGPGDDSSLATTGPTSAPATGDSATTLGESGSPSDDATSDADDSSGTDGQGDAGDLSLVPPGATDLMGNPAGQGFVEFNGVRYDFILTLGCQHIFGAVQGIGPLADGSDGRVDSIIPPEDWETDLDAEWDPPSIRIDLGDDSWRAEAGSEHFVGGENVVLTPEQSSVTSFTNNGSLVTGEAIFYSAYNYEEIETASGAFEFFCP